MNSKIVEIDKDDLNDKGIEITHLLDRSSDAIIVKNVFSEFEIKSIKESLKFLNKELINITPVGFTIPFTYTDFTTIEKNDSSSLSDIERLKTDFLKSFNIDIQKHIEQVFRKLIKENSTSLSQPNIINTDIKLIPFSIRVITPYNGSIQAHCENFLYQMYNAHKHITLDDINLQNSLSYFIVINKPDFGGDLTLYNLDWETTKSNPDFFLTKNEYGKIELKSIYQVDSLSLNINEGDLIIFAAGQIWHKVEKIKGLNNRCTIGGFIAESKKQNILYYWS